MILDLHPDLKQLPSEEKLQLISELWDEVAARPEDLPVTEAQKREIDRRLVAFHERPEEVTSWESIKARLLDAGKKGE